MIISSAPLVELVPVQPAAMEGRFLCQWDKDSCDDARMVKIDFLALGMLSLVEECLELIAANGKPPVDLSRIDFDDQAIYDMICAGDTIGIFQIESRAQIQMLPRTQPRSLEDLVVQVAIVRPGSDHRRRGQAVCRAPPAGATWPRPSSRTTTIPFWTRCCAETLRRHPLPGAGDRGGDGAGRFQRRPGRPAPPRDDPQALARGDDPALDQFRDGAVAQGVDQATAEKVFKKLLGFAAYGFPKAMRPPSPCWPISRAG